MIFTTPWFLAFCIGTGFLYSFGPWPRPQQLRPLLIICASFYFYFHCAGGVNSVIILALATLAYLTGLAISGRPDRRPVVIISASIIIFALIYFKYVGFMGHLLYRLSENFFFFRGFSKVGPWLEAHASKEIPLGISFFTFEFFHYIFDVSKGSLAIRNPMHFSCFALFFPRLAAGPIIRFQQVLPQFENLPKPNQVDLIIGLTRVSLGFLKKFLIADPSATLVERHYQMGALHGRKDVLFLMLFLYIRIYVDFSAYSDMAIGLARFFGIRLPENFNFPFLASTPSTFWQRWHISLSSWIRDYVYIPLGGGRASAPRKVFNLLAAMSISGLWHGPSLNFVFWGFLHGVCLITSHFIGNLKNMLFNSQPFPKPGKVFNILSWIQSPISWALTQATVSVGWVFFFFPIRDSIVILSMLLR